MFANCCFRTSCVARFSEIPSRDSPSARQPIQAGPNPQRRESRRELRKVTTTQHRIHDSHSHMHGEGCGHVAVPHGDHVDYVHDGHRHAEHQGHWDDH